MDTGENENIQLNKYKGDDADSHGNMDDFLKLPCLQGNEVLFVKRKLKERKKNE